jgi:nucleotide-binding universal stress UspA family protein
MIQPVVVAVTEGSEARSAVALGVAAARLLGAPLVLAGVVVEAGPEGATAVAGRKPAGDGTPLRCHVTRELLRRADAVPDGVPCTVHVTAAPGVLPGLELAVAAERAQLLVLAAAHLGPPAPAARDDVGLGAVQRLRCPVLVVPDGARVLALS